MIADAIKNKEIYMPLIFFVATGFMVPNYDDVTYFFLLNFCRISHEQFTYLAMNQSLGIIIGLIVYVKYLKNVEVWKLILASLCFNFLVNTIQYCNFLRINVTYFDIGDIPVNAFIMLLGKGTQTSLSVVPMTVMMMNVIPANIEASMFAFITAILTFSTDWGGQFVGGVVCSMLGVTGEGIGFNNFGKALILKNVLLVLSIGLVKIIPTNKEIKDLGEKLNDVKSNTETEESLISGKSE